MIAAAKWFSARKLRSSFSYRTSSLRERLNQLCTTSTKRRAFFPGSRWSSTASCQPFGRHAVAHHVVGHCKAHFNWLRQIELFYRENAGQGAPDLQERGIRKSGLGKPVMNAKRRMLTIVKTCCFCLPAGYIPPAEAEANYYRELASQASKAA